MKVFLLSLFLLSSAGRSFALTNEDWKAENLYTMDYSMISGTCFGSEQLLKTGTIHFGPQDNLGRCLDDLAKECHYSRHFFGVNALPIESSKGVRAQISCAELTAGLGGYPNCVLLYLGFDHVENQDIMKLSFENYRNHATAYTSSMNIPMKEILSDRHSFVLSQNGCHWLRIEYLTVVRKHATP